MATLKELSEASGVQGIAPGRTVGEQVNEDMYSSGELQYNDVAPADYGYTGQIQDGSKFQDPFILVFKELLNHLEILLTSMDHKLLEE